MIGISQKMAVAWGSIGCSPITGPFFRAPSHSQGQEQWLLLNPTKENRSEFSHSPLAATLLTLRPRLQEGLGSWAAQEYNCIMEMVLPNWS